MLTFVRGSSERRVRAVAARWREGEEQRSSVAERMIEVNGVQLCTEPFGDRANPPILLVMGIGASMLWWEEGFAGCSPTVGGS